MKHRTALAALVAAASLLGTAGMARATHQPTGYSPCRPGSDDVRLGYSDDGDQSDPRHELPTIYANGDENSTTGNVGVCGGNSSQGTAQFIEVGNDDGDNYVRHSEPSSPLEATNVITTDEGSVIVGDDYVEVDGAKDNTASHTIDPRLDGYVSAGLSEDDGQPGICASGDNDHAYYDTQPQQKDCNEALLAAAQDELG